MAEQPGGRCGPDRSGRESSSSKGTQGGDVFSDLQRWLLRSGAKSMRRELGGQVRGMFGTGRTDKSDVWDEATTEIPPEVGEAPECQWCPICRAARAMRDSSPGLGGHISGAGDAVASAVQDAIKLLDGVLAKSGGTSQGREPARPERKDDPVTRYSPGDQGTASASEPITPPDKAAANGAGRTAPPEEHDTWSQVTDQDTPGAAGGQPDGSAHEPDDRG